MFYVLNKKSTHSIDNIHGIAQSGQRSWGKNNLQDYNDLAPLKLKTMRPGKTHRDRKNRTRQEEAAQTAQSEGVR